MKTFSFAEANQDFKQILDTVNDDTNVVVINRQNNDDAVIMSFAYYNSLIETLYLSKSPANAAHLAKSIEQYRAGKVSFKALT
ncbi:type II toxin-antitoxin system Phd/YefM family antitoxin [Psychrobacter sp. 1U1]|uniref:type II toxin-antitoxin system Phd/YefM family antitoxin n=1 Tax=Psychrobacter sp. 1U1 TaxID=3453576 RepID=UPI003F445C17